MKIKDYNESASDKNKVNKMKFKYGRAWAIDGSFYTEDKKTIESFLTGLYTPSKKDYTITDENGNAIALLQIDY